MTRSGRKREPRNVAEIPQASPFGALQQSNLLGRGLKSVKLGKERISGRKIKEALLTGSKIKMDGVEIDPQHLPIKHTGDPHSTATALSRLRARKHITQVQLITGECLQRLYWAGYGTPNPSVREYGKPAGGSYDPIQFICLDSQRYCKQVLAKFERRVTKWVYGSVLNIVVHDRDPSWVYGKMSLADRDSKKRIKAGFKELGRAFKK